MTQQLSQLLQENEAWLMERILFYSKLYNFSKYTSTLLVAWRMSISGLTNSLCMAFQSHAGKEPQFTPDEDYAADPISRFGRLEAQRHRERGITLSMFLGLLKYYRDAYVELVKEKGPEDFKQIWARFVSRSFDRFEIALCTEWVTTNNSQRISSLKKTNRNLANEKNKYLTIFESIPRPAFLLDKDMLIDSINISAANLLGLTCDTVEIYYSGGHSTVGRKTEGHRKPLDAYLPWLTEEMNAFFTGDILSDRVEIKTNFFGENKYFDVFFSRMLDVSDKFSGILILLDEITERKKLELQLNHLATTDALTGVHNRHRFLERAEDEVYRSERYNRHLSLFMLDIDHFKKINDSFGHAIGDDVLRALSAECRKLFRQTDIFGRIGGEEFSAILPETTLEEAEQIAERLRQSLAQIKVDGLHDSISFTVSIGVFERKEGQNLSDILYYADKALYIAKNSGRNKVVTWHHNLEAS
ncbi:MAG: diguanylate cyclase [Solidesulfovibrio sp. DCME]|uniref:GGDEF domain-containing protein n=1 Tax=Solidesulfovibrio sp. DCME TaxID=3447380 RepID=UPI003D0A41E2